MTADLPPSIAHALRERLARSHAPYSNIRVAAAVEDENGRVHYGVNVENAAYPEGVCAEASAISAAIGEGAQSLRRVYLTSSLPGVIWPCGGCRQKIWEFADPSCSVTSLGPEGETETHSIEALLPLGFRLPRP